MKKTGIMTTTILTVLMLITLYPMQQVKAANGPRTDLDIVWYTNPDSAYTALVNDEVDMVQWSLTLDQKVAVEANPNLQLGAFSENGLWEYDLQNNLTIADYPTSTCPTHILAVRQAIACLVKKDFITGTILGGFGTRLDAPVAFPQTLGWVDPSVVTFDWNGNGVIDPSEDNYPYPYSVTAAVDYLAAAGFSDTDANGYLNYPNNPSVWMDAAGKDTTLMPLKICIRSDDPNRLAVGRYLVAQLEGVPGVSNDSALSQSDEWGVKGKIGGDFDTTDVTWEAPRATLRPIVMGAFNYHVYTGGWSFGRFPTYQFSLFHSMFSYSYGPNYVTGPGTYPTLDQHLEDLYYAANIGDAQAASRAATVFFVTNVVNIPLWSFTSFVAWRKELAGVVNMKGYGIVNDYTFLNAYRTNAPTQPLRAGAVSGWDILNIMYSQWYFEYLLLDRVYNHLIAANPYDLATDIPWGAQDWETGVWVDPRDDNTKTTVTYWLRKDAGIAAPVTGVFAGVFAAHDYEFTCWYNYAFDDDWQWSNFMDINHIQIINDYQVKIYFEDTSMWFVYSPTYPLLGQVGLRELLCSQNTASFLGAALVAVGPHWNTYFEYQFTTDRIVSTISATVNGSSALVDGVDYYIRGGYDTLTHNVFCALRAFNPGDAIQIKYYFATPNGAGGPYLGGNLGYDYTTTMRGTGYMYPLSISTTSAALNKNPYFFLETPLLGEVDFRWYWATGAKPRSGHFKIDILDVVKCTGAYSTRGDHAFNPVYLPGADLDASDLCHIGILDLVTITVKYAQTLGEPPEEWWWQGFIGEHATLVLSGPPLFYGYGFSEICKSPTLQYGWDSYGTLSITALNIGDFLYIHYRHADNNKLVEYYALRISYYYNTGVIVSPTPPFAMALPGYHHGFSTLFESSDCEYDWHPPTVTITAAPRLYCGVVICYFTQNNEFRIAMFNSC